MLHHLSCAHPLLGVFDQQLSDEVLGLPGDVIPMLGGEEKLAVL